jgi:hypothetical protein
VVTRRVPQVRTINMLSEASPDGHGTQAFFRALSEADGFIHELERTAELQCRCDELTHLVDQIKELHKELHIEIKGDWNWCAACGDVWPCPTMKLIEET